MASMPLVSCIMIFWNAASFLPEAVASILAQTYEHWELVLVDDGSSDGSTAMARHYAAQHAGRIRYVAHAGHRNRGMSASRNLGLSQAAGEYIAFLDADDVWLPEKLAQQVGILAAQPAADMVYGRTLIWHSWTGQPAAADRDYTMELGVPPDTLVPPPTLFFLLLQNQVQTPTTCNAILRRRVFDRLGGFIEDFRGMYEDQAFFAKVQLQATVYVANACWAKYRQHPGSCSALADSAADYARTRLPFLTWLEAYLPTAGMGQDTRVWQALQDELWACRHPHLQALYTSPRQLRWHAKRAAQWAWRRVRPLGVTS